MVLKTEICKTKAEHEKKYIKIVEKCAQKLENKITKRIDRVRKAMCEHKGKDGIFPLLPFLHDIQVELLGLAETNLIGLAEQSKLVGIPSIKANIQALHSLKELLDAYQAEVTYAILQHENENIN